MAAHYAGADCKFNNYGVTATDEGWDKSSWFDVKPQFKEKHGLINLPYVIDNGFVVTQTNAVLMYLGRKFGLIGSTAQQTSIVEQVLCQAMDLRNDTVGTAYRTGDLAGHLSGNAPTHFAKLELYLQQLQTTYFGGTTPSVADFHIFEMIEQHQFMAARAGVDGFFNETPALLRLAGALKQDPRMASYFQSEEYGFPQNNKMAQYGATCDDGRPDNWRPAVSAPAAAPVPNHLVRTFETFHEVGHAYGGRSPVAAAYGYGYVAGPVHHGHSAAVHAGHLSAVRSMCTGFPRYGPGAHGFYGQANVAAMHAGLSAARNNFAAATEQGVQSWKC